MSDLEHVRHKPFSALERPRDLIVACPPLRSNVNLSRIVRVAGCCGITRLLVGGKPKIDRQIARDAIDQVRLEMHRSLPPSLRKLKAEGYRIVGLEQTTGSLNLHHYRFARRTVLVLGHERQGLDASLLAELDEAVEIPVYGLPYSYNVATATAMALYEYCRQYPAG